MKNLIYLSLVFLLVGCKQKDIDREMPDFSRLTPVVTARGTSQGPARTAQIGPAGGELRSEDGRLKVSIPAGALSNTVTVGVEPISNNAPLGLDMGYRLTPEGVNFAKPVKLTFSYENTMLTGSAAEFLWIVSQKADGTWEGDLRSELDAAARTVSTETSHFSDWVLGKMINLELFPSSAVVKIKNSVELMVTGFLRDDNIKDDDLLVPLTPVNHGSISENELVPLDQVSNILLKLDKFAMLNFKEWRLDGAKAPVSNSKGKLEVYGMEATYTAPDKKPSPDNVAVTVTIEARQKDGKAPTISINAPITITDREYYAKLFIEGTDLNYYSINEFDEKDAPDGEGIASITYIEGHMGLKLMQMLDNSSDNYMEIIFAPSSGSFKFECIHGRSEDYGIYFIWVEKIKSGTQKSAYVAKNHNLNSGPSGVCSAEHYICTSTTIVLNDYKLENNATVTGAMSGTLYYSDHQACKTTPIPFSMEFSLPLYKPL